MKIRAIVPVLSLVLLMSFSALSDVPDEITYQGRLLYNGNPVTTATSIVFRLFQTSSGGSAVWTETHGSVTPDSSGIYTVVLGGTVAVPDDYDALWLELAVAGNTLSPRKKLTSAPFVLRAGELPDLYVNGNLGIGTTSPADILHINQGTSPTGIRWERSAYETYRIGLIGPGFVFHNVTDNRYDVVCDGTGNVGIGTTSPGAKLDVNGEMRVSGMDLDYYVNKIFCEKIALGTYDSGTDSCSDGIVKQSSTVRTWDEAQGDADCAALGPGYHMCTFYEAIAYKRYAEYLNVPGEAYWIMGSGQWGAYGYRDRFFLPQGDGASWSTSGGRPWARLSKRQSSRRRSS